MKLTAITTVLLIFSLAAPIRCHGFWDWEDDNEKPEKAETLSTYKFVPVTEFAGKKFVFHRKPFSLRKFYYPNIRRLGPKKAPEKDLHPSYAECAGRTCTIEEVNPAAENGSYTLRLRMDDDGTLYEAVAKNEFVEGLIYLADVDALREDLVGKRLWSLQNSIFSYDEKNGIYYKVYAGENAPVTVIRVEPGWNNRTPVRIVLETLHEQEGYVEVNPSGTNVAPPFRHRNRISESLALEDPRSWDESTKGLIAKNMITTGMTAAQARASWGNPVRIETVKSSGKTMEKWVYPYGDTLYFQRGKLVKRDKEPY